MPQNVPGNIWLKVKNYRYILICWVSSLPSRNYENTSQLPRFLRYYGSVSCYFILVFSCSLTRGILHSQRLPSLLICFVNHLYLFPSSYMPCEIEQYFTFIGLGISSFNFWCWCYLHVMSVRLKESLHCVCVCVCWDD